ncbi:MAG TPA: hypothetical protein VFV62_03320 [Gaiellaceae bacterium]|nr:hypothetical protein [Gaiellaceae bacterium]
MSYDLTVLGPLDEARARALLTESGAEGEGGELLLERDGVAATFLVGGGEVGVGVTTLTGDEAASRVGFRRILDVVLSLAEELDAEVYDAQAGRMLAAGDAEEALRAFG